MIFLWALNVTSLQVFCSSNLASKKGNADKEGITVNYDFNQINDKKYDEDWCIGTVQSYYSFFLYDVTAANNA